MSFMDNAMEVLERTEASLHSLISDALKAKAYKELATIAAMAEAVAAISPGRSAKRTTGGGAEPGVGAPVPAAETPKAAEPSWMRPKS